MGEPALVRSAFLAVSLLVAGLLLVPVAPAAEGAKEPGGEINIDMRVAGFHIDVFGSESKGKQYAILYVSRGHQFAQYFAPAQITGYIHIDAPRVAGSYSVAPSPGCRLPRPPGPKPPSARAVPYQPYIGDGATLTASTMATKAKRRLRTVTVSRGKAAGTAEVSTELAEIGPDVTVVRGVQATVPGRAFEWDFAGGTATVNPAAPFAGAATFARLAAGRTRFTGSLRARVLGGETVHFAGAAFQATLHHGTPHVE